MNKYPTFKFALREDIKDEKVFLPTRGEPYATGWDVRACMPDKKPLVIKPGQYCKIPMGFKCIPEEGWWFQLNPRSSTFAKKHAHSLIGIIDEHYNLELQYAFQYLPDKSDNSENLIVNYGDAIGQIIPFKRIDMNVKEISNEEFEDLCNKRVSYRNGGFGSTDRKI